MIEICHNQLLIPDLIIRFYPRQVKHFDSQNILLLLWLLSPAYDWDTAKSVEIKQTYILTKNLERVTKVYSFFLTIYTVYVQLSSFFKQLFLLLFSALFNYIHGEKSPGEKKNLGSNRKPCKLNILLVGKTYVSCTIFSYSFSTLFLHSFSFNKTLI